MRSQSLVPASGLEYGICGKQRTNLRSIQWRVFLHQQPYARVVGLTFVTIHKRHSVAIDHRVPGQRGEGGVGKLVASSQWRHYFVDRVITK